MTDISIVQIFTVLINVMFYPTKGHCANLNLKKKKKTKNKKTKKTKPKKRKKKKNIQTNKQKIMKSVELI